MLRVVSWNVLADAYVRHEYYPRTPPALLDPVTRGQAVRRRLAALDGADVICLQEMDRTLFALAVEALPACTARLLTRRARGEGCALFIRRSLVPQPEFEEMVFRDDSGHVALAARGADVTVVCTHLKWEPDGTPEAAHRGRAQLAEILDRWASGPRVVCGDFNAGPESVVLALARDRGLSDAYASLPEAFTCNANSERKRIDFILCSAEFIATPSPLAVTVTNDTALPGGDEPSDHVAIEARLDRA